ncbi:MAG: CocE/NonD family hydrolase [bacterium]
MELPFVSATWRKILRVFLVVLLALAAAGCVRMAASVLGVDPGSPALMETRKNVMIPMSDGTRLATDVYLPADGPPAPVVLTRIPYGTDTVVYQKLAKLFVRNGYVFVAQDTRGTFDSEGRWFPFIFEYEDGHDTVEWVNEQQWSNGRIGMWGGSYFGYTQLAAAPRNPHLDCMVPMITTGNMGKILYRGGALEHLTVQGWLAGMKNARYKKEGSDKRVEAELKPGFYNAPLRSAEPILYEKMKTSEKMLDKGPEAWIGHPGDIKDLPPLNYGDSYEKVNAPSLLIAGWYDLFLGPQLSDYERFRSEGQGRARKTRIIIGPWSHGGIASDMERYPLESVKVLGSSFMEWYDYWLKGEDNGAGEGPLVKIFVMGENKWRNEKHWPLKRTEYTDFYLTGSGAAGEKPGGLVREKPGEAPPDQYDYDPREPVPTRGGNFLGDGPYEPGPQDQGDIPSRPDVLVYETGPLPAPVEVTGPVRLVLYAASSARDTDWIAKLVDIDEEGEARLLQEGIVRARYRNSFTDPSLIRPGQVYQYNIDMWATSNLFKEGHRIGLWIMSSDFPQFDRNTNAGGKGPSRNPVVATQTVFHDRQRPSHLVLPVIPR